MNKQNDLGGQADPDIDIDLPAETVETVDTADVDADASSESPKDQGQILIPIRQEIDAHKWDLMVSRVKRLVRGNCTLIPIVDDPLNLMIDTFSLPADVVASMFVIVPGRVGLNLYEVPYCIISHVFEKNNQTHHIDKSHKIVVHKTMNQPIVASVGNQLNDGVIRQDDDDPSPSIYVMAYDIVMDNELAQRALSLMYPLQICWQAFTMVTRTDGDLSEVPNTVMGITGIDIQKEVIELLRDAEGDGW
jgi:hypothetical protein